jgi:small subunit ribosomal protein S4
LKERQLARYTEAVCRLCRREGLKLFLKGDRCFKDKCAIERRQYAPGQHGKRRSKIAAYGVQLREKQKVKRIYGVLEKQFRRYFEGAERSRGITGEVLLQTLERRLDNVVYRIGFAPSRPMARQLVAHGHFLVNGKNVHVPSYLVKTGDMVHLKERSRKNDAIKASLATASGRGIPAWLTQEFDQFRGTVTAMPARVDIPLPVSEQLIVELYSK